MFVIITLWVVAVLNAMIVWLVSSQGWHLVVNRYFVSVAAFSVLWIVGTALFLAAGNDAVAGLGLLLFYVGPMFMLLSLCLFAAIFHAKNQHPFRVWNVIFSILTVAFAAVIIADHSILTAGMSVGQGVVNQFQVHTGPYTIYSLYFSLGFLIVSLEFYTQIRRNSGSRRKQLTYITSAMGIVILLSSITNIIMPILGTTQFIWAGPLCTFFAVVIISAAIAKHALFDIKLAAVRSAAYIGVLLTLSVIYYLFAYFVSVFLLGGHTTDTISVSPFNIGMALVLAFLFQPIKRFFDQVTNDFFYRSNYNSETFFAALSDVLSSTTDLRGLLERASHEIATTFKAEQAFFFVYYTNDSDHHTSAGTHGHIRLPIYDARMLDEYVPSIKDPILATDLMEPGTPVRRMLQSHRIAIVMPLREGDRLAGYVLLGDRRSGNYTKRDLSVLTAVSNELVIAIQNALNLHEVKELNATLQQRINVATRELRSSNSQLKHLDEVKDEFMSMASHQLRTPLTSIKGYLSMVLEGDAGQISPQQHKLLLEAFNSSERMVRLIADFLNVSRLQTGKFIIEKKQFDLRDVVREEVEDLQMISESHSMKLRLNAGKQPLPVNADADKLRQVIMNFIDNAIYYSHAKSTIVINLERVKNDVALTVVDTGIGVPEEEQAKLFTKFFRAGNARKARPDGTGVGLYLARRVISEHKGTIIFSSKEGKGSTFGFRLPLDLTKHAELAPAQEPALEAAAK